MKNYYTTWNELNNSLIKLLSSKKLSSDDRNDNVKSVQQAVTALTKNADNEVPPLVYTALCQTLTKLLEKGNDTSFSKAQSLLEDFKIRHLQKPKMDEPKKNFDAERDLFKQALASDYNIDSDIKYLNTLKSNKYHIEKLHYNILNGNAKAYTEYTQEISERYNPIAWLSEKLQRIREGKETKALNLWESIRRNLHLIDQANTELSRVPSDISRIQGQLNILDKRARTHFVKKREYTKWETQLYQKQEALSALPLKIESLESQKLKLEKRLKDHFIQAPRFSFLYKNPRPDEPLKGLLRKEMKFYMDFICHVAREDALPKLREEITMIENKIKYKEEYINDVVSLKDKIITAAQIPTELKDIADSIKPGKLNRLNFLQSLGILALPTKTKTSPPYLDNMPFAGMFNSADYYIAREQHYAASPTEVQNTLVKHADHLLEKYYFINDKHKDNQLIDHKDKCICLMFAMEKIKKDLLFIPFFGVSGTFGQTIMPNQYLELLGVGTLGDTTQTIFQDKEFEAIPEDEKQKLVKAQIMKIQDAKYPKLQDSIMMRQVLGMKIGSKQAMSSFIQYIDPKHNKLDIEAHHSLQCGEPASVLALSYLYTNPTDMELSIPYSGPAKEGDARPYHGKHTCARCALSEKSFAAVLYKENDKKETRQMVDMFKMDTSLPNFFHPLKDMQDSNNTTKTSVYGTDKLRIMEEMYRKMDASGIAQCSKSNFNAPTIFQRDQLKQHRSILRSYKELVMFLIKNANKGYNVATKLERVVKKLQAQCQVSQSLA